MPEDPAAPSDQLDEALRPVYLDYLRNAPADQRDRLAETREDMRAPHRKGDGAT